MTNTQTIGGQALEDARILREHLSALRPAESEPSEQDLQGLYALAHRSLQGAEYATARAIFEMLRLARPERADFVGGVAYAAFGQGEYDTALSHFVLATALEPNNPGLMVGLGRAYRAVGLPGHARLALQIAEQLAGSKDPKSAELARACLTLMGEA
jgi:Flp pilus assembly protein TadD